ncbi:MAG TPA: hypothetical protein VE860_18570 [Chthoniobacterales bacterium]|nr:hypothetical protein [Chthoniobacterales bacterium]
MQRLNQHIGWATDTVASFVPAGEKVVPAVAKPAEAAPMTGIDSQGLLYVGIAFATALLITVDGRGEVFGPSSTVRKIRSLALNDLRKGKRAWHYIFGLHAISGARVKSAVSPRRLHAPLAKHGP